MAVWNIAWANLKKKKGVAFSMAVLVLLAAAMFNVGLTLYHGIATFYDRENERLHAPHYLIRFEGDEYKEEYLDFLRADDRVKEAVTDEAVLMNMANFPDGGVLSPNFINIDQKKEGYIITESRDIPGGVYIPSFMKEMGYEPGGSLRFQYKKQDYEFPVAGFFQSTWCASSVSSLVNIYMPKEEYEKLYGEVGGGYLTSVRVADLGEVEAVRKAFREGTDVKIDSISVESKVMDISINEMRNGSTMVVTMLSAVLFCFAFLMVLVAVLVMRFRIFNHIESQMASIGALKAMGYTGRQVEWSISLEFLVIGLGGTVCGIGVSYLLIFGLGQLITNSVGVAWKSGAHPGYDLVSMGTIMVVLFGVLKLTAGRAFRLTPVEAFCRGIKTHNFKKSHFPLDRTGGRLPFVLGLKAMMVQKKTYLMVGMIFAGVAFACAFSVITYWNLGRNNELALQLTGYEISDILVYAAPHTDLDELKQEITALDGVRKTSVYEPESAKVEGELITCYVSTDYEALEMVTAYEGEMPVYDNEIVVTGTLARAWGKGIGDSVTVQMDGKKAEYVICGLGQTLSNFGRQCFLSDRGVRRLKPAYTPHSLQLYLEPGIDIDSFIALMEKQFLVLSPSSGQSELNLAKAAAEEKLRNLLSMYGVDSAQYALMADGEIILSGDTRDYKIDRIENNRKMFVSNVDSIASSAGSMSIIIIVTTVFFLIPLVLYMVIRSMLVRQSHEFGIYKAIGYTNRQLMAMVTASFMPAFILGTFVGCLIAGMTVEGLLSVLFEGLGVSQFKFGVSPGLLAIMGAAIVAFSYVVSMAVAGNIRKITVTRLLMEE